MPLFERVGGPEVKPAGVNGRKHGSYNDSFWVKCDCTAQGQLCPSLLFSQWIFDDDTSDDDMIYACPTSMPHPWRSWWTRIKYACRMLFKGLPPYVDDICLEEKTLFDLADKLGEMGRKMRDSRLERERKNAG